MTSGRTIEILSPVPSAAAEETSTVYDLAKPVTGVDVGLRFDASWRSYFTVVDEWEKRLVADGARVHRLLAGDRVGPGAEQTRSDIEEWSRLVEVGVVGLGN